MVVTYWAEPIGSRIIRLILFSAVIVASLFGNSLIIKTVLSKPRKQVPFSYHLVMNLAIGELLNTICLPFLVAYDELYSWVFGQYLCQIVSPLQILANSVSTSTLAAIAVYRSCVFVSPRITIVAGAPRSFLLVGLFLWGFSIALALPNFLFNAQVESTASGEHFWCVTLFPGDTLKTFPSHAFKVLMLIQSVMNFVVTSAIMVLAYGIVMFKIKSSGVILNSVRAEEDIAPTLEEISLQDVRPNAPISAQPASETAQERQQNPRKTVNINYLEADLFKMFYAIILIFIVCYFPYQVVFMLEYFGVVTVLWKYFILVRKYAFLLTCFPSALHPLCYGLMTQFYAKAFSKLILCK